MILPLILIPILCMIKQYGTLKRTEATFLTWQRQALTMKNTCACSQKK